MTRASLFGSLAVGAILLVVAVKPPRRFTAGTGFKQLTLAAMLLGWPPFLWFSWQVIGGMEIDRHSLSGTYEYRMGALLLAGYAAMLMARQLAPQLATGRRSIDTSAGVTAD